MGPWFKTTLVHAGKGSSQSKASVAPIYPTISIRTTPFDHLSTPLAHTKDSKVPCARVRRQSLPETSSQLYRLQNDIGQDTQEVSLEPQPRPVYYESPCWLLQTLARLRILTCRARSVARILEHYSQTPSINGKHVTHVSRRLPRQSSKNPTSVSPEASLATETVFIDPAMQQT